MGRVSKRSNARDKKFFDALAKNYTIGEAAKIAGYSRTSVHEYTKNDPVFAEKFHDAKMDIAEKLEKEADRRSLEGVIDYKSLKTDKGQKVVQIRKYSDTLLMFRLRALKPSEYRDNYKPPELDDHDLDSISDEDLDAEIARYENL
ncbi:hypothetical protein IHC92_20695 [Photobacterium damselae subsp. damselae]|uniref:hypothetical protein n=1 Tax=Photobacterium damselae TaxID=38293 RepID=UPI001F3E959F|nr:hypothetical protein [Photobacterium damselae]UKA23373.1 hypothetical protein IHC92_20695 [Photobacterium damselae subsp. damselae]